MKKLIIPFAVFIILQTTADAQDSSETGLTGGSQPEQRQNSWFIEIGGSSPSTTVNYERLLSRKPGGFSIRAGIGIGTDFSTEIFVSVPFGASYSIPISKHKNEFLEVGGVYSILGGTSWITKPETTGSPNLFAPQVSYKYQSLTGRFQLRLTVSPYFIAPGNEVMNGKWLVGVSLGKRF